MTPPFFSIIIPTYNREHLLSKAIESVIAQTYSHWELIIVDDGSTDNTKELIQNLSNNDSRIRYIYQENAERSAARNNGILKAKGKYICFLDSDDYYLPNHLCNLKDSINDSNTIYYSGLAIDNNESILHRNEWPVNGLKKFNDLCIATIHSQQVCIPIGVAKQFLFNKSIRIAEDLELWIRINEKFPFKYIENSFQVVVLEHADRSINIKFNTGEEQLRTYRYIFSKNHPGHKISSEVKKKLLSNSFYSIFKYWFHSKNRSYSIYYLLRSLIELPWSKQTRFKINVLLKLSAGKSFSKIEQQLFS
jgi:glycosyltransferase involved in cell wall biosynthesis